MNDKTLERDLIHLKVPDIINESHYEDDIIKRLI